MTKALLASLALALSLSAPAVAQTTVSFAYWGDPAELPPFEKVVADYQAAHPDVTIEVQHAPWSGYFTKLDAQLAAGAGPDVFFITNVPTYAARNQLEDLGPWIAKTGFPIDEYNQNSLDIHSLGGRLYSIPRDNGTTALYYNIDAFDAAGIAYPGDQWKWADLKDAARKLTTVDGGRVTRYGLALESNEWVSFVRQNGGEVFDSPTAPTKFLLAEPKAVEAIQFIGDLINVDKSVPNFIEANQAGGTAQLFASGQAAMTIANSARLGAFKDVPFKWAVAPLPAGPDGTRANILGGAGFAMNANSRNKDAAWDFLQYLAGPEGQIIFTAGDSAAVPAMTGNEKVRAAFTPKFAEVFLAETENGHTFPQFPKFVDVSNLYLQPALDLVWNGEAKAADALSGIKAQVDAVLAE